jgi:hypothetical protein
MVKSALYAAIGFVAISSTALAEDLSSATASLPPGTFTTSAHSDEWKIANALSAGPASITEDAAVIDWPANPKDGVSYGRMLGQGTNGWTCMPDIPGRPQHDPMCVDETMMKWLLATLTGKKPDIDRVGLSYMLMGEARQDRAQLRQKTPARSKNGSMSARISWSCFRIQPRTGSVASIRISPITSPIHRSSVPQM